MKKAFILLAATVVFIINAKTQTDSTYTYTPHKENVVASAIEGTWVPDCKMENQIEKVVFEKDTSIVKIIPRKYFKYLKEKPIYFAGYLAFTVKAKKYAVPCILTSMYGNPQMIVFRPRDGNLFGYSESFNLFIARKEDPANDILFIGGDHNGVAFTSYKRVVK